MTKPVQHYICEACKGYNDILNILCSFCKTDKPTWLTHRYQTGVEFDRSIFYDYGIYGVTMTKDEELYTRFFNHQKLLVKDMDIAQLREHREMLAVIALEAKARVSAADEAMRELRAETSKKEWLITDGRPDFDVSAAINVPEVRKKRMTAMDRLREQLRKSNLDESIINEMIGGLEKKATASADNLKTVTFNTKSVELKAIQMKKQPNGDSNPVEPFNPAKLFGKKE